MWYIVGISGAGDDEKRRVVLLTRLKTSFWRAGGGNSVARNSIILHLFSTILMTGEIQW